MNGKSRVLIVDDDRAVCELVVRLVEREGATALVAKDGKAALDALRREKLAMLIVDMRLPDMDGMEVLRQAKALDEDLPVVMLTAYADVPGAVKAMRAAAFDYLAKPYHQEELIRVVRRALAEREVKPRLKRLPVTTTAGDDLAELMGPSATVRRLVSEINNVAKSNFSVVILGETGSGKEVVAQAIRRASMRAKCAFVPVDCGAIPDALLEAELFGHEKGAFTGAAGRRAGRFEQANGGTLLLDEISNLPLTAQAKILRALQERTIYRVGGTQPIALDVRVLAAGNQDLEAAAAAGRFRPDLYYRLNEFTLRIPPLRERKEDILYLAQRFLDLANRELHKRVSGFSERAIQILLDHRWPGNVRQLRSTIRRAVLLTDDQVEESHLDIHARPADALARELPMPKVPVASTQGLTLKEISAQCVTAVEREVLVETLRRTGGNKAHAARLLQIDYKTIQSKLKRYGITLNEELV